jgi:hypothetical protein
MAMSKRLDRSIEAFAFVVMSPGTLDSRADRTGQAVPMRVPA